MVHALVVHACAGLTPWDWMTMAGVHARVDQPKDGPVGITGPQLMHKQTYCSPRRCSRRFCPHPRSQLSYGRVQLVQLVQLFPQRVTAAAGGGSETVSSGILPCYHPTASQGL